MTTNQFNAGPSLTGYLYQLRYALLGTLERIRDNPALKIYVENLDDVHFESGNDPVEIVQTKHHLNRAGHLTDASPDIWKSLRVWCSSLPPGAKFADSLRYLVTTSTAQAGSAASLLKTENRNITAAEKILTNVTMTSTSVSLKPAFEAYNKLSSQDRLDLLQSITVIDAAVDNQQITSRLNIVLYGTAPRDKLNLFSEYLEGWWIRRVLKQLTDGQGAEIIAQEVDAKIDALREDFKADALPLLDQFLTATVDQKLYQTHTFVKQLKFIDLGSRRIASAVNNYYRAYQQRSRWVREDLLLVGDLDDYEALLIEEWKIRFEEIFEDVGPTAAEAEKKRLAKLLYKWAEQEASIPIRHNRQEAFITRGSLQILADVEKVGWHPDFKTLLQQALAKAGQP